MPYVLTFNKDVIEKKIIKICEYLEFQNKTFDELLNWTLSLRKKLNIPHKLSDVIELEKIDIDRLSKMALDDPSTNGNPKKLSLEDMKVMYEYSISGELFK